MLPLKLMRVSPTYAAWRAVLVRALARTAPEVLGSRIDTRGVEIYMWAHCDPDTRARYVSRFRISRVSGRYAAKRSDRSIDGIGGVLPTVIIKR